MRERSDQRQPPGILATDGTGLITSFSKRCEDILGTPEADVVGKASLISFHDPAELAYRMKSDLEPGTEVDALFGFIVTSNRRQNPPYRHWTYVHRTGRRLPIDLFVSPLPRRHGDSSEYVFVLQEILPDAASSDILPYPSQLLDLANDAILIRHLKDDTITYWNDGAARLYGWTSKEAHSACSHDLLQTIFPRPLAEIRTMLLTTGFWTGELVHRTKSGRQITVSSRWTLLKNADDVPIGSLEMNTDITAQKRAQEVLAAAHEDLERRVEERTTELSDANIRLQVLSRRLMEIQELDRRAIARDLHDEIGQALTAIKMNLRDLSDHPSGGWGATAQKQVSDSVSILDQVLQRIRNIALDLRPSMLDELGLVPALRWYVGRQAERAGWTHQFCADPSMTRASPEVEIACFRLAQEALTNVARHAKATAVEVHLEAGPTDFSLVIRDDGIGFEPDKVRTGTSIGLSGMEERVRLAGGTIDIRSAPAAGTEIRAAFPLPHRMNGMPNE
jgi:two-component system sensor histidine kinase UhpB